MIEKHIASKSRIKIYAFLVRETRTRSSTIINTVRLSLRGCAEVIKIFNRRQLLIKSCALSTTLLLKACQKAPSVAKNTINSATGDKSLPLQFINVPPTNSQAPKGLLVCLHGFGSNAKDLAPFAPVLNLPNYQILFPDAPYPHPRVSGGRMWYNLDNADYQGLTTSRQQLTDWLKSLENTTGVPLSRTILSGFSQGGAMTLDVGLTLPLAGLISLSGYLHSQPQTTFTKLPPVLIVHGRQDQVVTLSAAQRAKNTLTNLGVAVKYQEFDMGHEIKPEVLSLMRSFILDVMK
ncbi:MAG: alpha/beta hydrolase [Coleofasciculaceae cyanobacterium]